MGAIIMSEYQYMEEFLKDTCINSNNIIIQEVNIEKWGVVQIYIVEKYKDNVFTITTGYGNKYEPIDPLY